MSKRARTARPFVVLGLMLLAASSSSSAQDDIEDPAGSLPEGELEEATPADATVDVDPGADAAAAKDQVVTDVDEVQANWESYEGAGRTGTEISKGVKIEDIVEPPADYHYAAFGKGDPFLPPMITAEEAAAIDPLEIPIVSPLQRYPIDQLKLVGVWQGSSGERKAMVMVPSGNGGGGQGIIVTNGDPIGIRGGRILSVGDDYLTVREFSLAPDGTRQYEDQQMFMGRRAPEDLAGKIRFTPGKPQTELIVEDPKDGPEAAAAQLAGDRDAKKLPAAKPADVERPLDPKDKQLENQPVAAAPANPAPENVAPANAAPAKAPAAPEPEPDIGAVKF